MNVVILAGGMGTRLQPETTVKPKPMVEIGGRPILWHIMRHYSFFGMNDFVIGLGYQGEVIKRYMIDYGTLNANVTVDFRTGNVTADGQADLDWRVRLIDTGLTAGTGARVRRLFTHLDGKTFMMTYGDGVADIDLRALLAFHCSHGRLATLTAVHPPARFGHLEFDGSRVARFSEKPQLAEGWINGGFFVLEPGVLGHIPDGDGVSFERDTLQSLAAAGELMAYNHTSFWQCMDTPRDKRMLESLWESGQAPWRVWS